ncbi:hypothetical protein JQC92_16540 [Shewanella sp. 202IG2-18]|uniref:hypothetical protein n=1 Tax=Parashewanella hymeniacidonis TaxID=2807618 RepID=UPI001961A28C|nr:hypothetical protein [Parashewanella hymeniacidonis]MBM7073624.1 hypothetical protein [Parashewanella hymeniacidonis]
MFRMINFLAFIGCIVWLYLDPSPEPVVVLLMSTAAFFRDDIHGIIGKNIFSLTPKSKLVRDFDFTKYSFVDSDFINPRILEDLCGWLSDTGDQIVSINIEKSNKSNRYFGKITSQNIEGENTIVTSEHDEGWFKYQYLGCSFSGVHILRTWSNTGGSGVFCNIVMVTLSVDSSFEQTNTESCKINRLVIKLVGSLPLGDRYDGSPKYKFGVLSIPACNGIQSLRTKKSSILVV